MVTLAQVRHIINLALAPIQQLLNTLRNGYNELRTWVHDLQREQTLIRYEYEEFRDEIQTMIELRMEEGRSNSSFSVGNPNMSQDRSGRPSDEESASSGPNNGGKYVNYDIRYQHNRII